MVKSYKNFWSLNIDEAIVTGILRNARLKDVEILMPLNAQMKGIDLVVFNTKNMKLKTIQVKGSKGYDLNKSQIKKYGNGSAGWFSFHKDVIHKSTADFFIFLVYVIEDLPKLGRQHIEPHIVTIPTDELTKLAKKYKRTGKGGRYNFYFLIDPIKKHSIEFRDDEYSLDRYLDKSGFDILAKALK